MTKASTQKLLLWLPLLVMAFYTSFQIHTLHTKQTSYYAVGAGAAEAARPATAHADDATQQWASTLVGAAAGGGTGASTGLDGEKKL